MKESSLAPGTIIRSPKREYIIRDVLGQGGFGITYLVESTFKMENLEYKGKFALKELFVSLLCEREPGSNSVHYLSSAADEMQRAKQAFTSEAYRLQSLGISHTNIVNVNEVFEANNTAYYVMEYVEGVSLATMVRQNGGRLSMRAIAAVMQPLCDAVAMLHRNMVAHYDIKPQNIMVQRQGGEVKPVLIDFGLSKHYDDRGHQTSQLLQSGFTPGFAPLEQYGGLTTFSPTADIYALAAVAVYCITGHAPATAAELDLKGLRNELTRYNLHPKQVDEIIRDLDRDPQRRTADADIFARRLFTLDPNWDYDAHAAETITHGSFRSEDDVPTEQYVPSSEWTPPTEEVEQHADPLPPTEKMVRHEPITDPLQPTLKMKRYVPDSEPDSVPDSVPDSEPEPQPKSSRRRLWITLIVALLAIGGIVAWQLRPEPKQPQQHTAMNTSEWRTNHRHLDLLAVYDDTFYFFSQQEWKRLPYDKRKQLQPAAVVVEHRGSTMLVALGCEQHPLTADYRSNTSNGERFTWDEAQKWAAPQSPWCIPSAQQAEVLADIASDLCAAITAYGGDANVARSYWTADPVNSSTARCFSLSTGALHTCNRSDYNRLLLVLPFND